MPVIQKMLLIPVEVKMSEVKKGTGIKKAKIKFVNSDMKFVIGWNQIPDYWEPKIQTINSFDSSKAVETEWELSEWDGVTKRKLITGFPVEQD